MTFATIRVAFCLMLAAPNAGVADTVLFSDQQVVNIDFTEGLIATWSGSRGKGKFHYTYRAASRSFGPLQVVMHDRDKLTVRGTHTACTLRRNRTVSCADGSTGRWALAR